MATPTKLLVPPELAEIFLRHISSRRAVELTVQIIVNAAMDQATKKNEEINLALEEWWRAAGAFHDKDFLGGSFILKKENGQTFIVDANPDQEERPAYGARLDS